MPGITDNSGHGEQLIPGANLMARISREANRITAIAASFWCMRDANFAARIASCRLPHPVTTTNGRLFPFGTESE